MSLCFWSVPGIGVKLYTGYPGNSEYGSNREPVPSNWSNATIGEHGRNKFHIYLSFHWNYFKCGKERGAVGRKRSSCREHSIIKREQTNNNSRRWNRRPYFPGHCYCQCAEGYR